MKISYRPELHLIRGDCPEDKGRLSERFNSVSYTCIGYIIT